MLNEETVEAANSRKRPRLDNEGGGSDALALARQLHRLILKSVQDDRDINTCSGEAKSLLQAAKADGVSEETKANLLAQVDERQKRLKMLRLSQKPNLVALKDFLLSYEAHTIHNTPKNASPVSPIGQDFVKTKIRDALTQERHYFEALLDEQENRFKSLLAEQQRAFDSKLAAQQLAHKETVAQMTSLLDTVLSKVSAPVPASVDPRVRPVSSAGMARSHSDSFASSDRNRSSATLSISPSIGVPLLAGPSRSPAEQRYDQVDSSDLRKNVKLWHEKAESKHAELVAQVGELRILVDKSTEEVAVLQKTESELGALKAQLSQLETACNEALQTSNKAKSTSEAALKHTTEQSATLANSEQIEKMATDKCKSASVRIQTILDGTVEVQKDLVKGTQNTHATKTFMATLEEHLVPIQASIDRLQEDAANATSATDARFDQMDVMASDLRAAINALSDASAQHAQNLSAANKNWQSVEELTCALRGWAESFARPVSPGTFYRGRSNQAAGRVKAEPTDS